MRYRTREGRGRGFPTRRWSARVTAVAAALKGTGLVAGDRVAMLSENRPEWAITDYAAVGLGIIDVPLYPTLPANQVEYILRDCEAQIVFVSTAAQADKIREIRADLPALRHVIVFDDAVLPGTTTFESFLADGQRAVDDGALRRLSRARARRAPRRRGHAHLHQRAPRATPRG